MFIFRPTKFAAIYSLGNVLSLCRWVQGLVCGGLLAPPAWLPSLSAGAHAAQPERVRPSSPCPASAFCMALSICLPGRSTMFLMGPVNQIKRMFDSKRW